MIPETVENCNKTAEIAKNKSQISYYYLQSNNNQYQLMDVSMETNGGVKERSFLIPKNASLPVPYVVSCKNGDKNGA